MKISGIYVIILVLLSIITSIAQNDKYYYYQGKKIYLSEKEDMLFVTHNKKESLSKFEKSIKEDVALKICKNKSNTKDNNAIGSSVMMESKNKISDAQLLSFRKNKSIASVYKVLKYKDSVLVGLTNEIIVKLKESTNYVDFVNYLKGINCVILNENQFVKNQFLISLYKSSTENPLDVSNKIYESGLFEFAEPNFSVSTKLHSNDTYFNQQWGLKNTGQTGGLVGADISIEQAWAISEGRPEVRIAVIDDGVDLNHPDLKANLVEGYDGTGENSKGAPVYSYDNHGTACAGIIGAIKDNGIGVTGIAPKCKIVPIKLGFGYYASSNQQFADAINWAWSHSGGNADVLSNSWGGGLPNQVMTNAINSAISLGRNGLGSVVVFSTGNNGSSVAYPANLPNVIAVGASTKSDFKADYSNYGEELDVVAPGGSSPVGDIYTTDRVGNIGYNSGDYTPEFNGTSAACPHVAGIAGLVLSINRCLTGEQVKQIIELSCDKTRLDTYLYQTNVNHPNGTWNNEMGHGRVNAFTAVKYARSNSINNFNTSITTSTQPTAQYSMVLNSNPTTFAAGVYFVKRYEVSTNVTFPYTQAAKIIASSNGFSNANPNTGESYAKIENLTETSATLRAYVYSAIDIQGRNVGWMPVAPTSISFNYIVFSELENNSFQQNKNITQSSVNINAIDGISAGSKVTNLIPFGNYNITGSAAVKFMAGKNINLKAGTTIKPSVGGSFKTTLGKRYFTCTQYPNGRMESQEIETTLKPEDENISIENSQLISVYPNPATTSVTIGYKITETDNISIKIFDATGKEWVVLKNKESHLTGSYETKLENLTLPLGNYFIQLKTDKFTSSKPLIINP